MKQSLEGVQVVLLDIEGTVCPISFVKETLFPYALKALPSVLEKEWTSTDFEPYKSAFPLEAQASPEAFLAHVEDLTKRDVKIAYLKNLQGYLWESGYKSSAYSTPLFEDITPAIFSRPDQYNDNHESNKKKIAIYSSGSIFAQKLLFAHSKLPSRLRVSSSSSSNHHGKNDGLDEVTGGNADDVVDLTAQISAYFDTTTAGPKTMASSYTAIFEDLSQLDRDKKLASDAIASPHAILFLSDNVLEVKAALEAGLKAVIVDRPGNAPLTEDDLKQYDVITSFDQLSWS